MRIGIFTDRYKPIQGGRERQIELLALGLKAEGHEVIILTSKRADSFIQRLGRRIRSGEWLELALLPSTATIDDVSVRYIAPLRLDRLLPILLVVKRLLKRLPRVGPKIRDFADVTLRDAFAKWNRTAICRLVEDVDVIHVHEKGKIATLVIETAKAYGKPVCVTPYVHINEQKLVSLPEYKDVDAVFALLPTDVTLLRRLGVNAPIKVCGIAVGERPKAAEGDFRARHGLNPGPIVLFVGRLVRYKGVQALAAAGNLIQHHFPDAQIVFIGPDEENIAASFVKGEASNLFYLGEVSNSEKQAALEQCACLCLPSIGEVFPVSIAEAWLASRPVVAGPAYGLRELIEGCGGGLHVEQDPESIASAITFILSNPGQASSMGLSGKSMMTTKYADRRFIGSCLEVYKDLVGAAQ